jgi:uroporphyrinogen decarboxylase
MTELKNDLLLRALMRQPVPRTPLWIMRQAGRYLPEYRETRAQAGDFMSLCRNPDLACEVTMQPLRRYALDAAILFSDILTVPDAMGLGLYLRTIRRELDGKVPLIGFAGSPFTCGTYMVEGGSSREFPTIRGLAKQSPEALDELMDKVAVTTTEYLNAQIEAGAQAVQIFDTWGAALEPDDFRRFSLASMQKIVDGLTREKDGRQIPVILFTKGAGPLLKDLAETGCDALGVDWTTDLADARDYVQDKVALQGNLDPATLRETPEAIREGVARTLASYGEGPGHVFNLGHGITPDIDPDNLGVLVDAVHEMSPQYHK